MPRDSYRYIRLKGHCSTCNRGLDCKNYLGYITAITFNAEADALQNIVIRRGASKVLHYLEDFLILGFPDSGNMWVDRVPNRNTQDRRPINSDCISEHRAGNTDDEGA